MIKRVQKFTILLFVSSIIHTLKKRMKTLLLQTNIITILQTTQA